MVYTQPLFWHIWKRSVTYARLPLFCGKKQKWQGQPVPQQARFKHPILINSVFSLTHKHPTYHQTLKRPLICNFFFFRLLELAHLADRENTDLYCCVLFWRGKKHMGGPFFLMHWAAHGSVNESENWWLRAGTLMTVLPSPVSASVLTGAEKERRMGAGGEKEQWDRNGEKGEKWCRMEVVKKREQMQEGTNRRKEQ